MISINDIVWSDENENENMAYVIPINCMAYNCAYHPVLYTAASATQSCANMDRTLFDALHGSKLCSVL